MLRTMAGGGVVRALVSGAFLAIVLLLVCGASFEAAVLAAVAGMVAGAVAVLDYAERRSNGSG